MGQQATGAEAVHWTVEDIYPKPSAEGIDVTVKQAEEGASRFETSYRGRIATLDAPSIAEGLHSLETIKLKLDRASASAYLTTTTRLDDTKARALLRRTEERVAIARSHLSFFGSEFTRLQDDRVASLMAHPTLAKYTQYLTRLRKNRVHLLSPSEEGILAAKSQSARRLWAALFEDSLGRADTVVNGDVISLTSAASGLGAPDPAQRAAAASLVTQALAKDIHTRRSAYMAVLSDKATDDRLRHYSHWLSARNLANDIPDDSVEAAISAVAEHCRIAHRFYSLKKHLLGLDAFHHWDRTAPMEWSAKTISWDRASMLVRDGFQSLSPSLGDLAEQVLSSGWIDAAPGASKRPVAFTHPVSPIDHPYISLHYSGHPRDVLTLAHEVGHAVHALMSRRQSPLNFQTPVLLSEMASTLGETITLTGLQSQDHDSGEHLMLMFERLEAAVNAIFRPTAIHHFEQAVQVARETSIDIPINDLSALWMDTQMAVFGPEVERDEEYAVWWSWLPHLLRPGYFYAYALGNLIALTVLARFLNGDRSIAANYLAVLEAGASRGTNELLSDLEINLEDETTWSEGLAIMQDLLDKAERLRYLDPADSHASLALPLHKLS